MRTCVTVFSLGEENEAQLNLNICFSEKRLTKLFGRRLPDTPSSSGFTLAFCRILSH